MRHAMYYLPEYAVYELQVGEMPIGFYAPRTSPVMVRTPGTEIALPPSIKRLVWFVDHWSPQTERPAGLAEIEIPHGRYLYVLSMGRRPLTYAGYTFIRDEPGRVRTTAP
jgi:hypothetical protein